MEKLTDPKIIDYYIINRAIPSITTIKNRYQIDFGNPNYITVSLCLKLWIYTEYISIYLYKIIYVCRIIDDLYIGIELHSFILEDFYDLFLDISIKLQRK